MQLMLYTDFCKYNRHITRDIFKQLTAGTNCRSCSIRFNPNLPASFYFQFERHEQINTTNSAIQDDTVIPNRNTDNSSDSEES